MGRDIRGLGSVTLVGSQGRPPRGGGDCETRSD